MNSSMKKKISQKELVELRKKEQARKEMEYELGRDLKLQGQQQDREERNNSTYNRAIIAAFNFFGTLIIFYAVYFLVLFKIRYFFGFFFDKHVEFPLFVWYIQILFWITAFWSLFSKKGFFDVLLQKYTEFMS